MGALNLSRRPTAVADLASELNLPLGVVRILLADLRDAGSSSCGGRRPGRATATAMF